MITFYPKTGKAPRVVSVSFKSDKGCSTFLAIDFDDGRRILVPVSWYPRLQHGSQKERNKYEFVGDGEGIHWPDLDEDVSVEGVLAGHRSHESQRSIEKWLQGRTSKLKRRPAARSEPEFRPQTPPQADPSQTIEKPRRRPKSS